MLCHSIETLAGFPPNASKYEMVSSFVKSAGGG
jgi:hypothetical protein